jgi:hypothetical protein
MARQQTFLVIAVIALAVFSVANAQRALLQEGETATAAAPQWYPGMNMGAYGFDYWRNLYGQIIPYDIYANWVNQNTQFNLPVVTGLPGLPASGST